MLLNDAYASRYPIPFPNGIATKYIGCHGSVLEKSKRLNEVNKHLHPSTNPEILVKLGPLSSELPGRKCRPLKKEKNKDKTLAENISLSASVPRGLNKPNQWSLSISLSQVLAASAKLV